MGILLTRPILVLMNTPEGAVLEGAVTYMQIVMLGVPFSMFFNFCSAILRTSGQTKPQFIYLAISGLVNVGLNLLLVIVFDMGVVGVAVGTVDILEFDPQNLRFGVGVLIYGDEHRRRGYARAALDAVARYGREVLGVRQIWASVAADNAPSIALFEGLGYERCAVRRDWLRRGSSYVDLYDYQLIFE
jgi:GNAT superfamily N-acetyltransferase